VVEEKNLHKNYARKNMGIRPILPQLTAGGSHCDHGWGKVEAENWEATVCGVRRKFPSVDWGKGEKKVNSPAICKADNRLQHPTKMGFWGEGKKTRATRGAKRVSPTLSAAWKEQGVFEGRVTQTNPS